MAKGPDAFRTISEVAEWLDVPTHVLRFWESRFSQIKPVKRAGGRRYYRPADMQLLGGIKRLLHDEGLTIRGVQKLLREEGVRHIAALSPPLDGEAWDAPSAKVISLNPRSTVVDGPPPDRWPFTDEAEQAAEMLTASLAEGEDLQAWRGDTDTSAPTAREEMPAAPSDSGGQAKAPEESPARPSVAHSFFDESTVVPPPLVIAPLAATRRSTRARKARALSSALVEAELLARSWDARA